LLFGVVKPNNIVNLVILFSHQLQDLLSAMREL